MDLPLPSVQVLKKFSATVSRINALESQMASLTPAQLRAKTDEFRSRYQQMIAKEKENLQQLEDLYWKAVTAEDKNDLQNQIDAARKDFRATRKKILDSILPEAFAVVRETGKRVLNMRHFDVQLIGGMVLNEGNIAEMATGEGKTLVATLPAYLNALTSEGVHVVTVNDYLASRDRAWMGPIYEFLGLTIGVIEHDMAPASRQQAYGCDITYGTNNEFGFDYLRDNMVISRRDMVQRGHYFAIVDEVDSILIDEARTPLIISGPAEESTDKYYRAYEISRQLTGRRIADESQEKLSAKYRGEEEDLAKGFDYVADEKTKAVSLSEAGEEKAAKLFGIANIHDMETIEYRHHILQALKAKEFFAKDVEYVVRDGEVLIVDEFTGRLMPGRRWSDGLHQAVEAKEGIRIERENQTLATITFQNYFRMYEKLSGMTGTAYTEANEFKQIYNLDVAAIPANRKLQRVNHADCIYKTIKEKFHAVVTEIEEFHKRGQPVLVGTISIEKSEMLSKMLKQKGIAHQVLNAKYHEREAHIIAQAGRHQAVTIATNMAGRGTDIMLGGNAEHLAKSLAEEKLEDKNDHAQRDELTRKFIEQFRQQVREEHEKVVAAGGLHVLGTERHESRRIDNQLRGRQGRQGDPGSSRFYVSLEDDLMRLFASDRIMGIMDKLGMEEGQVLEHPWLTMAIENAQKRVEAHNFEIRKHLLEFDDVMNRQREAIYSIRRYVLESHDVKHLMLESIEQMAAGVVATYALAGDQEAGFDVEGLDLYLKTKFHFDLGGQKSTLAGMPQEQIQGSITQGLLALYETKEKDIGAEQLRQMERMLLLQTIDAKWKDHLYAMDQLKEGIGLRSFAQRDPVIEYKREGFAMFQTMYDSIHQEVTEMIFKIQRVDPSARMRSVFGSVPQKLVHDEISSLSAGQVLSKAKPYTGQAGLSAARLSARQGQAGLSGQRPPSASLARGGPPVSSAMPTGHNIPGEAPLPPPSPAPVRHTEPKVGRNAPCPCGSGKKYKKCCGGS
ncbi:MAG: preprotein translocase subunit SecA [Omnitrophica WOR_2 bacterium RIFCSPHIGHO2_01_FULL_52_10]|nr:MAG: preprotein translocase subunit SecA [Omnitrophica WOR_2 bacterium RIFCSPHIGHO2_01_FULL_52_10]